MKQSFTKRYDIWLLLGISFLILFSVVILRSIAPHVFPLYFVYLVSAVIFFIVFSQISFEILSLFSWQFYVGSIIFLIIPLLIGQVTRGAVRWIPLGPLTIQPGEIVRPFLLVFFANYLTQKEVTFKRLLRGAGLLAIPLFLILVQPSLGVATLTFLGFVGVLLASGVEKKYIITPIVLGMISLPLVWLLLAPYQKSRITTFLSPETDPTGAGYNSIQSVISVGSGKLLGRGLGQGVQTQLSFLPEKQTDFIFASTAEELGFVGVIVLLSGLFLVLSRVILAVDLAKNFAARAFISGVFLTLFAQVVVHVGMNLGMLPITGQPLPLVSWGGSSLLATMIMLGMVAGARKNA